MDGASHKLIARISGPVLRRRQRRFVLADLVEQSLQRRSSGLYGITRLQSRKDLHPTHSPVAGIHPGPLRHHRRLHENRNPDLWRLGRINSVEPRRRHAHNRHRVIVHQNLFAHHTRISREAGTPIVITQHCYGMAQKHAVVIVRVENAPNRGLDAEHGKEIPGYHFEIDALGLIIDAH